MMLNEFTVPGHDLKVHGRLALASDSLSGDTSASARSHKGIKPKQFDIQLSIHFADHDALRQLIAVSEAQDSNGDLRIYHVVEPSLNVAQVRQVQFVDSVTWRAEQRLKAWRVRFHLAEYNSVAEKVERQQELSEAAPPGNEGVRIRVEAEAAAPADGDASNRRTLDSNVTDSNATDSNANATPPADGDTAAALSGFEAFLAKVDQALA